VTRRVLFSKAEKTKISGGRQKGTVTNVSISPYREVNFVSSSKGEDKQ
jgi:hypothetical protein